VITVVVKTVSTNSCSGIPQYVENGGYVDGSKVQNAGSKYECKPYPYSGWCNGAAWAYAPGTGAYWQDAWTSLGLCTSAKLSAANGEIIPIISPNPATEVIVIGINEKSKVTIYNSHGTEVISEQVIEADGMLSVNQLSNGIYYVRIDTGSEIITQKLIKQ
jgi:hypothetical protein